ncbi:MAG: glycosyltransferase family 4 protein [bacterium]|nr:glycosyltransferase family 4 protein [bacterium]
MRIAVVVAHFPPRFLGGTEAVALAEARSLSARGHDVVVLSGCDELRRDADVESSVERGVEVRVLPRTEHEPFDLTLERPRLAALLESELEGFEAIHVHGHSTLTHDLVRTAGRHAPVLWTVHDHFATCPRTFRQPPDPGHACPPPSELAACVECLAPELPAHVGGSDSAAAFERELARRLRGFQAEVDAASAVIFPSRTHLVRLAQHLSLGPGQAHILGHGLCLELPARRRRPRPWAGTGPLRLLHAGRRSVDKGTLDLVRAAAPLAERVELVLAGGPVDPVLDAELVSVAGDLRLELSGEYDGAGLARIAASCHIAALPSRLPESYALALDEALALGLPAWVASGEAGRERFGGAALHSLPAADPEAWRAALVDQLSDPRSSSEAFDALPRSVPGCEETVGALEALMQDLGKARRRA